jgi:hypothetical protein
MQNLSPCDITRIGRELITVKCRGGNIIRQGRLMDGVTKDSTHDYSTRLAQCQNASIFFTRWCSTTEYNGFQECKQTVAGGVRGRATAHTYAAPGGWLNAGGDTGEYANGKQTSEDTTNAAVRGKQQFKRD